MSIVLGFKFEVGGALRQIALGIYHFWNNLQIMNTALEEDTATVTSNPITDVTPDMKESMTGFITRQSEDIPVEEE